MVQPIFGAIGLLLPSSFVLGVVVGQRSCSSSGCLEEPQTFRLSAVQYLMCILRGMLLFSVLLRSVAFCGSRSCQ